MHGGDLVAEVLVARGTELLFTLCGGHISPILVGCKQRGIRVVDTRHEVTAVFAADAVSRLTGRPGVAAVTAGPGVTNTITAIKNAQLAQSPLVLLGGATATALSGRGALQDIDQMSLVRPHVKRAFRVRRLRQLAPALEQAFDIAQRGVPGPVFVECPIDLLYPEDVVRDWYAKMTPKPQGLGPKAVNLYLKRHVERLFARGQATPVPLRSESPVPPADPGKVARAMDRIGRAERPVLLVGSQAVLDAAQISATAAAVETIGIPTYLSGMARGLLGRSHPLHMRHKRRNALNEADLVVLAGVPCDFRLDYGTHIRRSASLISVNRSRADLTRNRRPDLGVLGDPGRFLYGLAAASRRGPDRWSAWRDVLRARDDEREREIVAQSESPVEGLNPLALCRSIEERLDDDSVLVADGGDFVGTASYIVRPRSPLSWLDPGVFGTLGVGAGFALGAKLVRPDAEAWVLFGDGSVGYSLAEFDTFARHGIPIIAVVGNDACWMQIARDQVEILKDDVGCALARTDYHAVAAGFGARGMLLDDPSRTGDVLHEAKRTAAAGTPVLINAHIGRTDFRKGSISV